MGKGLIYFSFLLMLLSSCEEYYTPSIDTIEGQLVVEAQMTNDPSKNFVHLTKTRSFYDEKQMGEATGANVELVEISGIVIQGNERGAGYFDFDKVPVIGNSYKLRILFENETYESKFEIMPPLPTIPDTYSGNKVKRTYSADAYGTPVAYDTEGRDIYIDIPITDALGYYRLSTRSILQWLYKPPPPIGPAPPPPTHYYWRSYCQNGSFNIAGPKTFSQSDKIEKHPILWLAYDPKYYLFTDTLNYCGWILVVDQYGTSKGSFEFHEKLNSQFAADGSLFDPIQTQVYGNITCITDPKKMVYGYFDLNSYRQYRYYTSNYNEENGTKLRQIFRYPSIIDNGEKIGSPPDWWEY